jgi:multimeric flavodoxin WrbA
MLLVELQAFEKVADRRRDLISRFIDADGFIFVTGEYNWRVQPGLKNLMDRFLEEWFWRPRRDRPIVQTLDADGAPTGETAGPSKGRFRALRTT